MKRLSEHDVGKFFKGYETSLSKKTCEAIVDTFFKLACMVMSSFLPPDDAELLKDLNDKFTEIENLEFLPVD